MDPNNHPSTGQGSNQLQPAPAQPVTVQPPQMPYMMNQPAPVPAPQAQQPTLPAVSPAYQMPTSQDHAVAPTPASIDDQWISLAKDVAEKTRFDPYLQSKELGKLKAGYLKARYGKDIKLTEE